MEAVRNRRFAPNPTRKHHLDSQSTSKGLTHLETRSSLADGNKRTRETLPFSSFKQRWTGEKQAVGTDTHKSLASLRSINSENRSLGSLLGRNRGDNAGLGTPLSKLKELRQSEARNASRTCSGISSRSNFSLAERLSQTSYGRDKPLFQHRRTAASQLREIKQISRDGSIITKTSQSASLSQEKSTGTRSRAGSGSLKEDVLLGKAISSKVSGEWTTLRRETTESDNDENAEGQTGIGSKLRSRRYERSYGDYVSKRSEISKRSEQKGDRETSKTPRSDLTDTASRASELLQRILSDKSRPFPSLPIDPNLEVKEKIEPKPEENLENEPKCSSLTIKNKSEHIIHKEVQAISDSRVQHTQTSALAQRIEEKVLRMPEDSVSSETPSFERSREIASKIFQKLDSKKDIEAIPALQRLNKSKLDTDSTTEQLTVEKVKAAEKQEIFKKDEVEVGSDHKEEQKSERDRQEVLLKIHKTKAISIPPAVSNIMKCSKSAEAEVKVTKKDVGDKEPNVVCSVEFQSDVHGVRSHDKTDAGGQRPKTEPINIPPAVLPKPKSPKSSIVLGSADKITVSIEQPKDEEVNDNVFSSPERCESSIEEPEQMSVASLRNSLFGGNSSLDKIFSRGMGGTLTGSPVLLRKQLMVERRQVVSSVEITQHGKTAMSMAQMSFRVETKSESDSAISTGDSELLPTLFTRFEKPKKPKTSPKPRVGMKTSLQPVTLQVKLNEKDGAEKGS
ncbi:uncharacterized protein LOC135689562 isoform X1 [Rhopilema esculentum]|uniref:uncharacterized protein LOC135689562 isoform X1 n=1 Tax=Rhopilema esculentum TaxID=499914 RepID=UPI0031E33B60